MENEVKRKLDFLKKKVDEVIDEQIRLGASTGKLIDLPDAFFIYMIIAVEYTSNDAVAEYLGTDKSAVDSFCVAVRDYIDVYKTHKEIYNEIKKQI